MIGNYVCMSFECSWLWWSCVYDVDVADLYDDDDAELICDTAEEYGGVAKLVLQDISVAASLEQLPLCLYLHEEGDSRPAFHKYHQ